MAKINNIAAYAISTPVVGSDIVIGSEGGNNGDTKNFQMSDIATYVMSVNTLTLQDVCDNGSATTTGITVAGTTTLNGVLDANSTADISGNTTIGGTLGVSQAATFALGVTVAGTTTLNGTVDINNTADISGNTTIGGTLGVSQAATFALGVTIDNAGLAVNGSGGIIVGSTSGISSFGPISGTALNSTGGLLVSGTSVLGEIDSAGPADIADTLTLSRATGTGLQVDSDANVDGELTASDITVTNDLTVTGAGTVINVPSGTASFNSALIASLAVTNFILTGTAPSSATDAGTAGQVAVDADYIYVCVATNTWKRVAIATW